MRIPIIIKAMGYIDDKHLTEAMEYRGRKIQWLKYGALAACVVLVVAVAAFALRDSRIPVRPDPDITTAPIVTEPTETTAPDDVDLPSTSESDEMPPPFSSSEGTGGDANSGFYMTTNSKLDGLDGYFCDLVGWDAAVEWMQETSAYYGKYTAVDEAANLYSFIKHFDIPDETVRDYLVGIRSGDMYDFTDEEIDLILSDDTEAVAEHFAWESAIRKGDNLYSLNWIYLHPIEDYIAAGITPEDIEEVLQYFQQYRLSPNATYAFEQKLCEYIPSLTHESFIYTNSYTIYNNDLPEVTKEFVIVGIDGGESDVIYLVGNNKEDGDDNIYAALFMPDQGIEVGFDSIESWKPYQAYLSQHGRSAYYDEPIEMSLVGSVVQIVWDGLCESDGNPKRLTWISRLQYISNESVYSESEIQEFAAKLDGNYLSASDFEGEMFHNNPGYEAIGNGYDLLGYLGYYYPDSTYDGTYALQQLTAHLSKNAEIIKDWPNYIIAPSGSYGVYWYLCDYELSGDEVYLFVDLAKYSIDPIEEGYDISNAGIVNENVTAYLLVPKYAFQNTYMMLKYCEPVERDGKTVYGELYMSPIGIDIPMDEGVPEDIVDEPIEEIADEVIE